MLAEALIDPSTEVKWVKKTDSDRTFVTGEQTKRGGSYREEIETVSRPGRLLRLKAGDAFRFGMCRKVVKNFREVVEEEVHAMGAVRFALHRISRSWYEPVFELVSNWIVTGLLIIAGVVLCLVELKRPGTGLSGSAGLFCFGTAVITYAVLGTSSGMAMVLFLVGTVLMALEIFVTSGHTAAGVIGLIFVLFSLVLSRQGFILPDPAEAPWELEYALDNFGLVLLSGGAGLFSYLFTLQFLPESFFHITVVCPEFLEGNESADSTTKPFPEPGREGVVVKSLHPIGALQFEDRMIVACATDHYVKQGTRVQVIDLAPPRLKLRPL